MWKVIELTTSVIPVYDKENSKQQISACSENSCIINPSMQYIMLRIANIIYVSAMHIKTHIALSSAFPLVTKLEFSVSNWIMCLQFITLESGVSVE